MKIVFSLTIWQITFMIITLISFYYGIAILRQLHFWQEEEGYVEVSVLMFGIPIIFWTGYVLGKLNF